MMKIKQFPKGIPPGNHVVRVLSATEDIVEVDYLGPEHEQIDREKYLTAHPKRSEMNSYFRRPGVFAESVKRTMTPLTDDQVRFIMEEWLEAYPEMTDYFRQALTAGKETE